MKKSAPQKMNNHAEKVSKWSRNGIKTYEKSIHKQVTGNIMQIIKNHGKIIEIHCKNKCFLWFRRLHVRTVRVSKNIKSETEIHSEIDEQTMRK